MMTISLVKGQKIDLRKSSGESLSEFCVGVNWGAIESRSLFGLKKTVRDVDLDLSAALIDSDGKLCDHIYSPLYKPQLLAGFGLPPGKLDAARGALLHTGDDRAGDSGGDDGVDNEIITVNLAQVPHEVVKIYFFLNNCGSEDFSQIPYAKIRMFEGTPTRVKNVFAFYNVSAESQYRSRKALIMGCLYRAGRDWRFSAIGEATEDGFVGQTVVRIIKEHASL